jgi:hypothetical protein
LRNKQRIFEDERCQTVREKEEKKTNKTVNRSMDEKKREKVMKHDFLLDVRNERNILYKQKKTKTKIQYSIKDIYTSCQSQVVKIMH